MACSRRSPAELSKQGNKGLGPTPVRVGMWNGSGNRPSSTLASFPHIATWSAEPLRLRGGLTEPSTGTTTTTTTTTTTSEDEDDEDEEEEDDEMDEGEEETTEEDEEEDEMVDENEDGPVNGDNDTFEDESDSGDEADAESDPRRRHVGPVGDFSTLVGGVSVTEGGQVEGDILYSPGFSEGNGPLLASGRRGDDPNHDYEADLLAFLTGTAAGSPAADDAPVDRDPDLPELDPHCRVGLTRAASFKEDADALSEEVVLEVDFQAIEALTAAEDGFADDRAVDVDADSLAFTPEERAELECSIEREVDACLEETACEPPQGVGDQAPDSNRAVDGDDDDDASESALASQLSATLVAQGVPFDEAASVAKDMSQLKRRFLAWKEDKARQVEIDALWRDFRANFETELAEINASREEVGREAIVIGSFPPNNPLSTFILFWLYYPPDTVDASKGFLDTKNRTYQMLNQYHFQAMLRDGTASAWDAHPCKAHSASRSGATRPIDGVFDCDERAIDLFERSSVWLYETRLRLVPGLVLRYGQTNMDFAHLQRPHLLEHGLKYRKFRRRINTKEPFVRPGNLKMYAWSSSKIGDGRDDSASTIEYSLHHPTAPVYSRTLGEARRTQSWALSLDAASFESLALAYSEKEVPSRRHGGFFARLAWRIASKFEGWFPPDGGHGKYFGIELNRLLRAEESERARRGDRSSSPWSGFSWDDMRQRGASRVLVASFKAWAKRYAEIHPIALRHDPRVELRGAPRSLLETVRRSLTEWATTAPAPCTDGRAGSATNSTPAFAPAALPQRFAGAARASVAQPRPLGKDAGGRYATNSTPAFAPAALPRAVAVTAAASASLAHPRPLGKDAEGRYATNSTPAFAPAALPWAVTMNAAASASVAQPRPLGKDAEGRYAANSTPAFAPAALSQSVAMTSGARASDAHPRPLGKDAGGRHATNSTPAFAPAALLQTVATKRAQSASKGRNATKSPSAFTPKAVPPSHRARLACTAYPRPLGTDAGGRHATNSTPAFAPGALPQRAVVAAQPRPLGKDAEGRYAANSTPAFAPAALSQSVAMTSGARASDAHPRPLGKDAEGRYAANSTPAFAPAALRQVNAVSQVASAGFAHPRPLGKDAGGRHATNSTPAFAPAALPQSVATGALSQGAQLGAVRQRKQSKA